MMQDVVSAIGGQESLPEALMHLKMGAALVYGLQFLKKSKRVTWVTEDTPRLSRWLSAITAFCTTVGINATYDPQMGGTIALPALAVLAHGIFEWLGQWLLQQMLYDGLLNKPRTP